MSRFWRKRNEDASFSDRDVSFLQWAAGQDLFSHSIDFQSRIQHFLCEVQKRSLADQILLVSLEKDRQIPKFLSSTPAGEKPLIQTRLLRTVLEFLASENKTLLWEDLWEVDSIRNQLKRCPFETIIVSPITINDDRTDAIIIINYSLVGVASRVIDFIAFISSALSLTLQNARLYKDLQRKNEELRNWTIHVEDRLEAGTKKLLEKELQYHVLFEGGHDGIIVHDLDGKIFESNRAACILLGYSKQELLHSQWKNFASNDGYKEQMTYFQRVSNKEDIHVFETTLKRKNGSGFTAELSSRRVRFMDQDVVQTFIRDISMRKALEESLRESKEKYRILVESSLVGVFIIQKGMIQFANRYFEAMTGYDQFDLLEANFFDLVAPQDRNTVSARESLREMGEEQPDHYETRLTRKNGDTFWAELRVGRIIIDSKPAILGNIVDVTQRKQLENQLMETKKMESIGTLAGGIAHDFNNLLGGILGYASLLLSDMPEDHDHFEDIKAIADTTKRAADLTNRLLAFARGGKYQVNPIDLNRLMKNIVSLLPKETGHHVKIDSKSQKELWPVLGDSKQIHQALQNICTNSIEAMPDGGHLVIETSNIPIDSTLEHPHLRNHPGDYVHISISDTGVGMDEKIKSRVFEPFFTTKPTGEGTGFGLAMVYGVIKNHDGVIWIDSAVDEGTRIDIYLPRFIERKSTVSAKKKTKVSGVFKILLVDDEEVIRQVARRMLEKGGFEVLLAKNGKQALEIYESQKGKIDLILLDLIMPRMGGRETFRRLQEMKVSVPVVFTSGYRPQDRLELSHLGGASFIQKPFQTDVLIQTVWDVLQTTGQPQ